jgi:hypothetical protein
MTRYANDGMIRVTFAPAVSNKAAPTTAELNAGTLLCGGTSTTNWLTKDGLTVPSNQNMVDDSSLGETYDSQVVGSFGGPIALVLKRDGTPANDTAWNLIVYGLTGFIVVRRGIASATAWTAADKAEVYPVMFHEPLPLQTATNEQGRFNATAAVTSQPNLKATVA